jgi:hypothetical protein
MPLFKEGTHNSIAKKPVALLNPNITYKIKIKDILDIIL